MGRMLFRHATKPRHYRCAGGELVNPHSGRRRRIPDRHTAAVRAHESGGFTRLVESFDYWVGALKIFSRVPENLHAELGRRDGERAVPPERQIRIANLAYGSRCGNSDATSGDDWRYRGRSLKQITFRENYRACGAALGMDFVAHPERLKENGLAARLAGWFWAAHGCNVYADRGDFDKTTRVINGPAMEEHDKCLERYAMASGMLLA